MEQNKLEELTDQQLLEEAKKMKSAKLVNATLVGFMFGIIIFSIMRNNLGFFTLIPLFFIYHLINHSKNYKALEKLLKERNLKNIKKTRK